MPPAETAFKFEGFTLDLRRGSLRGAEGEIELRPKSFEVLRYLVENAGRLVPKDELIKAVWPNVIVTDASLARCVSDARLALGDRRQRIIRTVTRRGYLLAVPVSEAEADVTSAVRGMGGHSIIPDPQIATDDALDIVSMRGPTANRDPVVFKDATERRQLTVMSCGLVGPLPWHHDSILRIYACCSLITTAAAST